MIRLLICYTTAECTFSIAIFPSFPLTHTFPSFLRVAKIPIYKELSSHAFFFLSTFSDLVAFKSQFTIHGIGTNIWRDHLAHFLSCQKNKKKRKKLYLMYVGANLFP